MVEEVTFSQNLMYSRVTYYSPAEPFLVRFRRRLRRAVPRFTEAAYASTAARTCIGRAGFVRILTVVLTCSRPLLCLPLMIVQAVLRDSPNARA